VVNLWEEVIEMSTYGPSERKLLKAQRERQQELSDTASSIPNTKEEEEEEESVLSFGDNQAWMEAFAAAKGKEENEELLEFDGYAMEDLLIQKWGVPLDVDFQYLGNNQIYCTVLPMLGYSNDPTKARHESQLAYLMHLQGVVEILHKYDNLNHFIAFCETTNKVPKRGTDSVPCLLQLSSNDVHKIVSNKKY
jgi:hypothetical protein